MARARTLPGNTREAYEEKRGCMRPAIIPPPCNSLRSKPKPTRRLGPAGSTTMGSYDDSDAGTAESHPLGRGVRARELRVGLLRPCRGPGRGGVVPRNRVSAG